MSLASISNSELLNRMQKLVRTERKITHLVLLHILEIETRRLYAEAGFDGMYTYLTRGLGYSEAAAYRRLQSARLLKQVPEVAEKIESGSLNLSQLTQVQKCLKASAAGGVVISSCHTVQVLKKLENKNTFQTTEVLSRAFDLPTNNLEVLHPQKDESVRLEITLTTEQFEDLRKAKDILSHICFSGSWADVIGVLAKKCVSQSQKVNRIRETSVGEPTIGKDTTHPVIAKKEKKRKLIPASTKKLILKKAQSCCEYLDPSSGHRCGSRYQLQIDHIQPLAMGGGSEFKNLRVLCRTHNLFVAKKAGLCNRKKSWGQK